MNKFTYKKENIINKFFNNSWVNWACNLSVFCMLWINLVLTMYWLEKLVFPNLPQTLSYQIFYACLFNFIELGSMLAIIKWYLNTKWSDDQ